MTLQTIYSKYIGYAQLSNERKAFYVRRNFCALVSFLYEQPAEIQQYIDTKQLSVEEAQNILQLIFDMSYYQCICCKNFMSSKLSLTPIDLELSPLIDIVINELKKNTQLTN
jgi:hypothetical protein